jgi:diguanylate cyclase (GGDEF)-like protein
LNIKKIRSQFTIYLHIVEDDFATDLKKIFASSGYQVFLFLDIERLIEKVKQEPPHIVLFNAPGMNFSITRFFETVLEVSNEINFLCISNPQDALQLTQLKDFNLKNLIVSGPELGIRSLWAVDEVCRSLALVFQNESLSQNLEKNKGLNVEIEKLKADYSKLESNLSLLGSFNVQSKKFAFASSGEELISNFYQSLSSLNQFEDVSVVYLKFLPSLQSFVTTLGFNLNVEVIKGLACKISDINNDDDIQDDIIAMISKKVHVKDPYFVRLSVHGGVHGYLLIMNTPQDQFLVIQDYVCRIFQLSYENLHLQIAVTKHNILDVPTEFYNQNYFNRKLKELFQVSTLQSKKLSLIRFSLDPIFAAKTEAYKTNHFLKPLAEKIKSLVPTSALVFRNAENEFSILLLGCDKKTSAIISERLRRQIEVFSQQSFSQKITASFGVNEYPSLCAQDSELVRGAQLAMQAVFQKGGNKVCIYSGTEKSTRDTKLLSPQMG